MTSAALAHIEEAYQILTGEAYRVEFEGDTTTLHPLQDRCTIVTELERIDAALGPRGQSMFASIAETIQAAYVEIIAARKLLTEQKP